MIKQLQESIKLFKNSWHKELHTKESGWDEDHNNFEQFSKHFLITHTISILEKEVERLKTRPRGESWEYCEKPDEQIGYRYAQADQITHIANEINKIKEM